MERLFDLLLTQSGEGLTRKKVPGSAGFGSGSGTFGNNNASLSIPADYDGYTPENQLMSDISYTFNELMHFAGRNRPITDKEFSEKIKTNPVWANSAKKLFENS
jgi:hypothetical protein